MARTSATVGYTCLVCCATGFNWHDLGFVPLQHSDHDEFLVHCDPCHTIFASAPSLERHFHCLELFFLDLVFFVSKSRSCQKCELSKWMIDGESWEDHVPTATASPIAWGQSSRIQEQSEKACTGKSTGGDITNKKALVSILNKQDILASLLNRYGKSALYVWNHSWWIWIYGAGINSFLKVYVQIYLIIQPQEKFCCT